MNQSDLTIQHSLLEIFDAFTPVISNRLQTLRPDLTVPSPDWLTMDPPSARSETNRRIS
jgi:hypothetical protein